jgi:p-cumate 2,3-dioxygenase beta subunit
MAISHPAIDLRVSVEQFLFIEADLLDQWNLNSWITLFDSSALYIVPTTDCPDPDPEKDLTIICDDHKRIKSRVKGLMSGKAWAESPPSRTRRLVTNVVVNREGSSIFVSANFMIWRFRAERDDMFVGRYRHTLIDTDKGLKFKKRVAILDHETLIRQAMLSIIL